MGTASSSPPATAWRPTAVALPELDVDELLRAAGD